MPGISQIEEPSGSGNTQPNLLRHVHRLREISVQAIVEGSARARMNRAMNTRTTMPAERLDLKVGEEVDFFRQPDIKDTPGWQGPAIVADISRATRGVVTVRYQNRALEVQLANIRRHLNYLVFMVTSFRHKTVHDNVWEFIRQAIENMPRNKLTHLGKAKSATCESHMGEAGSWATTPHTSKLTGLLSAIKFFAENHLHIDQVVAARVGRGVK